jgi:outer membrane protein OmpA-like peptidoglycan-associated protein
MKKALTFLLVLCATAAFTLDLGTMKGKVSDKASAGATDAALNQLTKKLKSVQAQKGLIVFKTGSAEIDAVKSRIPLQAIHEIIMSVPGFTVQVEGHTDNVGNPKSNMDLSQKRADAVVKYLINTCKTPANRLKAKGLGDTQPIADNKTDKGRAANRRVDFSVTKM